MQRKFSIQVFVVAALLLLSPGKPHAAENANLDKLASGILESFESFYPVKATEMGIHHYDHRLADYSSKSVSDFLKKLTEFEKKLYKYKGAQISEHDRIDYELLKSNVDIAILDLKRIQWHKKNPQLYVDEIVNGVYFLILSQHAPMNEKVVTIVDRMQDVERFLTQARKELKDPPPIYVEAAKESLESGIQFYREVAGELMQQFPERADNILKVSTKAREAMTEFLNFLDEIKTGSEAGFAIGKENYEYKLSHEYFLDFNSDSMLALGEALLGEAQLAFAEYEEYVESQHQKGSDSVYVPANFTKQDLLDYYNWEVNQVKIFIEQNEIVSVPENIGAVEVVETPHFLRSMVSGIAYQPAGPFDDIRTGRFYVRPIPDDLDRRQLEGRYRYVHRRGFKGSVIHEAYPGHHLQMQIAAMNDDPVRKWQMNLLMIEGWALYCEEMMYEEGLFGEEDPAQWLGILGGIRFRAARIVADVKLHTGQFTFQQCVDWMNEVLESESDADREYIRKQVRKYTMAPTMPMTYLVGKMQIEDLRAHAMDKDGVDFDLALFHDNLLAEGSIPPSLVGQIYGW